MTLGTLMDRYIDSLAGRASQGEYRKIQRRFYGGPEWRDRDAGAITRYDLLLLRQELKQTPAFANKVLGLPKQAYRWGGNTIDHATKSTVYAGENPALHLERYTCKSRETLMDLTQLGLLLGSLDMLNPKYYVFVLLRILVPCRITELCSMRWDALDLTVGKWTKLNTKNDRIHIVPLPRQAVAALRSLPRAPGDPFVFMGTYGRSLKPGSARKIWGQFRTDLKMDDIWLLDFRRTLASYLYTVVKADDLLVKAMLNHYDSRPCAVYTRLSFDYLTPIIQGYADWVWSFKQEASADQLPFYQQAIPPTAARPISV